VNGEKEGKSWKCHATRHGNIIESDWESFGAAVIGDGGDSAAAGEFDDGGGVGGTSGPPGYR